MHTRRFTLLCGICVALSLLPATARAQQQPLAAGLGSEWMPIDPARLERMRGGFELPSGLSLSFGVERVVYVNGQLAAHAVVNIPDVSRMTQEQAKQLADFQSGMSVRIGDGNHFDASGHFDTSGIGAGALVIQNTLNDQDIRAATRLSIGVDTLDAFQNLNTFSALGEALTGAPGSP